MNLCGKSATYIPESDCECYERAYDLLMEVLSDYMTRDEIAAALLEKQNVLTAGDNITIENDVISADSITRDAILSVLGYEEIEIGYTDRSGNTVIANVIGRTETESSFNIQNDTGIDIVVYAVNGSDMSNAVTITTTTTILRFANAQWDHLVSIDGSGNYVDLNATGVATVANYNGGDTTAITCNYSSSTNTYSFISG